MGPVTIQLPFQEEQTAFNLERWAELLDDTELAAIEGRIETDRHGHIIMRPPPSPAHGGYQVKIGRLIADLNPSGRVMSECPISTADGVRAADVAWASRARIIELGKRVCFTRAPEICVEIISPRNQPSEIDDKKTLFFDAGAREVWIGDLNGAMRFFTSPNAEVPRSSLLPTFPILVNLD